MPDKGTIESCIGRIAHFFGNYKQALFIFRLQPVYKFGYAQSVDVLGKSLSYGLTDAAAYIGAVGSQMLCQDAPI